jgi:hypothetical protein
MQPHIDEPISPELVLVDPELAQRVRAFAVAGRELLVVRPPESAPATAGTVEQVLAAPAAAPVAVEPQPELRRPLPPVHRGTRVIEALAIVSVAAFLGLALLPPRDAPRFAIPGPTTAGSASSSIVAWTPRAGVDRYRVQLFYRGQVVYTTTVSQASMPVPPWLRAGRYTWRVFGETTGRPIPSVPIENGLLTVPR